VLSMSSDGNRSGPAPNALDFCLTRLAHDPEPPMFSNRLRDLLSLAGEDELSASRLAVLVLEDYGLTLKVLRVANSFYYNRSNRYIESITRAIVVLGTQTVRKLASTLAFFEHFEQRSCLLQQLLVRSMLSAHVAGITGALIDSSRREEAYLAGMFQNLGEVLVARCLPDQHAKIQAQIDAGVPANEASMREMGFSYNALAEVASRHWKLPPHLSSLWEPQVASEVTTLARFGNDTTRLMCRPATKDREAGLRLLMMRYGVGLGLTERRLEDIWERAVGETLQTFAGAEVKINALVLPFRMNQS